MKPENKILNNEESALTSIHETYTLSNTEDGYDEVDRLAVKHFLNTLAEIALAIASRKRKEG
jgi:hypothetical protein